jgi:hypothetical protein
LGPRPGLTTPLQQRRQASGRSETGCSRRHSAGMMIHMLSTLRAGPSDRKRGVIEKLLNSHDFLGGFSPSHFFN